MKTFCGWGSLTRPSRLRRSHTTGMQSKVHPTYKTKYRVANWPAYNRALVRRGDVTLWVSRLRYSDLAIETALTLRLLSHLPLRQAEGFLHALFGIMRLDLSVLDDTTRSRRSQHLTRRLRPVPTDEGTRTSISCSTARVCPSSWQVSGRPRHTEATARGRPRGIGRSWW